MCTPHVSQHTHPPVCLLERYVGHTPLQRVIQTGFFPYISETKVAAPLFLCFLLFSASHGFSSTFLELFDYLLFVKETCL